MPLQTRVRPRTVELLAKGQKYTATSLFHTDTRYTRDVVEHIIRYFWHYLSTAYENGRGEELAVVYCDITQALSKLEDPWQKKALALMMAGFEIRDGGIAKQLSDHFGVEVSQKQAATLCKRGYASIATLLGEH
jgi:hypothetical protein